MYPRDLTVFGTGSRRPTGATKRLPLSFHVTVAGAVVALLIFAAAVCLVSPDGALQCHEQEEAERCFEVLEDDSDPALKSRWLR